MGWITCKLLPIGLCAKIKYVPMTGEAVTWRQACPRGACSDALVQLAWLQPAAQNWFEHRAGPVTGFSGERGGGKEKDGDSQIMFVMSKQNILPFVGNGEGRARNGKDPLV